MTLNFDNLAILLPPNVVEYVGNSQLKLNLSQLTQDDDLTPASSVVQPIVQLLNALCHLTAATNLERSNQDPPLPPISFASKALVGTVDAPAYRFTIDVRVNPEVFLENLIDPSEST
jgi:hypothetical protein